MGRGLAGGVGPSGLEQVAMAVMLPMAGICKSLVVLDATTHPIAQNPRTHLCCTQPARPPLQRSNVLQQMLPVAQPGGAREQLLRQPPTRLRYAPRLCIVCPQLLDHLHASAAPPPPWVEGGECHGVGCMLAEFLLRRWGARLGGWDRRGGWIFEGGEGGGMWQVRMGD